jgi:hypothetical protein
MTVILFWFDPIEFFNSITYIYIYIYIYKIDQFIFSIPYIEKGEIQEESKCIDKKFSELKVSFVFN